MATREFDLGDVLSITTGRLVASTGMDAIYQILDHMTGDKLWTHQLGRASDECKPWLLRWFPELAIANACGAKLDEWMASAPTCPDEGIKMWLAELRLLEPKILVTYKVPRIPADDHERQHPWDELVAMRGTDEGIIPIVVGGSDDSLGPNAP